jgi:hypothetical protein
MVWIERYNSAPYVEQETLTTLGGRMAVFSGKLLNKRFITLESRQNQGWLEESVVQQCYEMSLEPANSYTLNIGEESFSVRFRHFDPPAFRAEQLNRIGALAPAGYYTAIIKLFTV